MKQKGVAPTSGKEMLKILSLGKLGDRMRIPVEYSTLRKQFVISVNSKYAYIPYFKFSVESSFITFKLTP